MRTNTAVHLIGLYTLFMGHSFVIILAFIRGEGAAGFLTTEHTTYSVFLNMSNYRSCNKKLANLLEKKDEEWIHYLKQKKTLESNESAVSSSSTA